MIHLRSLSLPPSLPAAFPFDVPAIHTLRTLEFTSAVTFFVVMELDLLYFIFGLCAAVYLVARRECVELPRLAFTAKDLMIIVGIMGGIIFMIWLAAVKKIV